MKLITFIIIISFVSIINAHEIVLYNKLNERCIFSYQKEIGVEQFLKNNNIHILSKSPNGWIRVFLSKTKRNKYHLIITKSQIKLYVAELKLINKTKIQGNIKW